MQITSWQLGHSSALNERPAELVPATTPAEVQLVWQKEKGMPDYNFGVNFREYRWMEDCFWHYSTTLSLEKRGGFVPVLTFEFLDYRYTIRVDGDVLADSEGMFTPVKLNLEKYAGQDVLLEVIFHPIPKVPGMPEDRNQACMSVKPPCSYEWDWHPRLVPTGLSGDVTLEYRPVSYIDAFEVSYTLADDFSSVTVNAEITVTGAGRVSFNLLEGEEWEKCGTVAEVSKAGTYTFSLTLDNPKLWWCRGQGEQNRYLVNAKIANGDSVDTVTRSVGFRRVKLVMNEGAWRAIPPQTQGKYPITIELNGRKIFAKGSNVVSPDIFFSKITPERYETLVQYAADANMNIFRMWGGSPVNKECFFDSCDRLGLMVWQEFTLSCNNYPDDAHYLEMLEKESASIIQRLRVHPSVVLWCGGNELFNAWSGMTNQSHALRLLDKMTYDLDRNTPFIMTSPLYGMGHGPYVNITNDETGKEAVSDFIDEFRTAYTEFGAPGPASYEYIKQYATEEDLAQPMEKGTVWEAHHAVGAHFPNDTWFRVKEIEAFYGSLGTLEENCARGQFIQACSYKAMFEEARRKFPFTSMAVNWCYNEPWPCFANNSVLMYPDLKRPTYETIKDALRDTMLSAKFYKLRHNVGDEIPVEVWSLNDAPAEKDGGKYTVTLVYEDGREVKLYDGAYDAMKANATAKTGEFTFTVPADITKTFRVVVAAENEAMSSDYTLFRIG